MSNISNRALVSHQPIRPGILEMLVKHAVQPPRFILVAIDPVLYLLRRIASEMVCLSLHGSNARIQEEEPGCHLRGAVSGASNFRKGWKRTSTCSLEPCG